MEISKTKLGGAAVLTGGLWMGRETLSWAFGLLLDLFRDQAGNMDLSLFPWSHFGAVLLIIAGALLVFWPKKTTSREDADFYLHQRAEDIVRRMRFVRSKDSWMSNDPIADIVRDGTSTLLEMEKSGFVVPKIGKLQDYKRMGVAIQHYLGALNALLRDGHSGEAREISEEVAEKALETGKNVKIDDQ